MAVIPLPGTPGQDLIVPCSADMWTDRDAVIRDVVKSTVLMIFLLRFKFVFWIRELSATFPHGVRALERCNQLFFSKHLREKMTLGRLVTRIAGTKNKDCLGRHRLDILPSVW
jgi:hypothetical protein